MKKITFIFCLFLTFAAFSQVEIWSDDFNDEDISDWTTTDSDGDGLNWGDISAVGDGMGGFVTPISLISRSWQGAPLTPDNWVVSPAIDLSTTTSPVTLSWITQVAAQSWDEEKYSVHVGTSSDIAVLVNSSNSLTETLGDVGNTGTPTPHTLDISSLAGEAVVYVAFRHWDCTDQDFLSVDDVTIEAELLSVDEFSAQSFCDISCKDKIVTISKLSGNANYRILSLTGKQLINGETRLESQEINATDLASGIYIIEVKSVDSDAVKRKKIIIQ